jgi:hypothetical protein
LLGKVHHPEGQFNLVGGARERASWTIARQ